MDFEAREKEVIEFYDNLKEFKAKTVRMRIADHMKNWDEEDIVFIEQVMHAWGMGNHDWKLKPEAEAFRADWVPKLATRYLRTITCAVKRVVSILVYSATVTWLQAVPLRRKGA